MQSKLFEKTNKLRYLFREGIILERHYVHPKCSPSRAALLTGRYAWTMGRQRGAIERFQPTGLSTEYSLLPEYLQAGGYSTHIVGKWHLGYCNHKYLPTRSGYISLQSGILTKSFLTGGDLTHFLGCSSILLTIEQGEEIIIKLSF